MDRCTRCGRHRWPWRWHRSHPASPACARPGSRPSAGTDFPHHCSGGFAGRGGSVSAPGARPRSSMAPRAMDGICLWGDGLGGVVCRSPVAGLDGVAAPGGLPRIAILRTARPRTSANDRRTQLSCIVGRAHRQRPPPTGSGRPARRGASRHRGGGGGRSASGPAGATPGWRSRCDAPAR